jgi:hypothetical protein
MTDGTTSVNTQFSHADAEAMRGTAKWARFIAIVGFVMIGIFVLIGLFAGSMIAKMASATSGLQEAQMEQMRALQEMQGTEGMEGLDQSMEQIQGMQSAGMAMGGAMYTVFFLIMAALIFFPNLLLYQFATKTLKSLNGVGDPATLTSGLNAHRRYYKFSGILLIIVLSIYAIALLIGGIGMMMM